MSDRFLVDANLLVYAYDRSDLDKQQRSLEIIDSVTQAGCGAVSTQVLAEFFVTITRKLRAALSTEQAAARVRHYLRAWTVLDVTGAVVLEAVRGVHAHRLNYWDAQVWAVARLHSIPVLLSEDFSDGANVEGVRFLNPLRPGFRAADWV